MSNSENVACFHCMPILETIEGEFTLETFKGLNKTPASISRFLISLKQKGYTEGRLVVEKGKRYNVYRKTEKFDAEKIKAESRNLSQVPEYFKKLREAKFEGTSEECADFVGAKPSTMRSIISKWRAQCVPIHIMGYSSFSLGGRATPIYKFEYGKDADEAEYYEQMRDIRASRPVVIDDEEPAKTPRLKVNRAFKNGASVVVIEGIKYINPKSEQWAHHG